MTPERVTLDRVTLDRRATTENFSEAAYLAGNPDVARAVAAGGIASGRAHFEAFGQREGRLLRDIAAIAPLRARKRARLLAALDLSLPHAEHPGGALDFLTDALRAAAGIAPTEAVSANPYDRDVTALVERHADGLVLDCGAGRRPVYHANVVNLEIAPYDTTDVLGAGEALPFRDGAFDAVISVAVLEHVRDPFRCAAELARVLKPGGELICVVPFLQPQHGYPHHYYNMAPQGLRALFERDLAIERHEVSNGMLPIWSLAWIVRSWAAGLEGETRQAFLDVRLGDLLAPVAEVIDRPWVRALPAEKNMELASATKIVARKPGSRVG
jgi:SAM-dependent methyltransferase